MKPAVIAPIPDSAAPQPALAPRDSLGERFEEVLRELQEACKRGQIAVLAPTAQAAAQAAPESRGAGATGAAVRQALTGISTPHNSPEAPIAWLPEAAPQTAPKTGARVEAAAYAVESANPLTQTAPPDSAAPALRQPGDAILTSLENTKALDDNQARAVLQTTGSVVKQATPGAPQPSLPHGADSAAGAREKKAGQKEALAALGENLGMKAGAPSPAAPTPKDFLVCETRANDWVQKLSGAIERGSLHGSSKLRIELRPEHLGAIEIELTQGPEGLQIAIATQHAQTGKLLEEQMANLRQALAQSGIQLSQLDIHQQSAGRGWQNPHQSETWQPRSAAPKETPAEEINALQAVHTSEIDYRV